MMKKIILFIFFGLTTLCSFSQESAEVIGLKLKISLVDLCDEIYQVNIQTLNFFTEENYQKMNCLEHYKWMIDVYKKLPNSKKQDLKIIRESIHPYSMILNTIQLNDTSEFESVLKTIMSVCDTKKSKKACERFYPFVYSKYIKDYLNQNFLRYDLKAQKINEEIKKDSFNILDFMENESGIKFQNKRKTVYYFTMRPIGAYGFDTDNEKIATIQTTIESYKEILGTPFHEFSHELFKTFTHDSSFVQVTDLMKTDNLFLSKWEDIGKQNYDWIGWCEENLVEGFSNYLEYRKTGKYSERTSYLYDLNFCEYLIKINFNPEKTSLEKACIDFYIQKNKGK